MKTLFLTLKVDIPCGSTIEEACTNLCELANRIGCFIEANCNDVLLLVKPNDSPELLEASYLKASKKNHTPKIATALEV